DAGRELVVAFALLRIPRPRIRRAVIDEIEVGVVGQEPPGRAAADLPCLGRPRRHAEILALVLAVIRLEAATDQHLLVRARAVCAPYFLAAARVERRKPAAHAVF